MEKLFEGEGFTSVQFAFPTQTSLLGAGLVNGICIDSGRTSTLISLIREGYIVENILKPVGGNTLSEEIMNIYKIPQKLANQLKKKCCVTQLEMGAQKMRIQLPDGQTITFKHRNDVPELLFSEHQLHLLPFTHQDVVLSGGNFLLRQLHKRMAVELFLRTPKQINVTLANNPKQASFEGAKQLQEFINLISKQEYEEHGYFDKPLFQNNH